MTHPSIPGLALLGIAAGCVINGDKYPRPSELVDEWMVDKTRLLAVQAEPPEVGPGASVSFSALFAAPVLDQTELAIVWIACPLEEDAASLGCALDPTGLDPTTLTPAELEELGVIGFEPGLPPVYEVPPDLLEGLPEADRGEGTYVLVQVTALPLDALAGGEEIDLAEVEAGYKRLVVSEAATPNHNPSISAFTVDGATVPNGATVYVDPNQVYAPGLLLADGSVEQYLFVPDEGAPEERLEEPYASWFTTGGELIESVTLFPYLDALWLSPDQPGAEGVWYAVVRDRRGGMAWFEQRWVVGP
jgi:hypothetical protein